MAIKVPSASVTDRWIWCPSSNGCFNIKSAYHLIRSESQRDIGALTKSQWLFDCQFTQRLWFVSDWGIRIQQFKHLSPIQWLLFILDTRKVRAPLGIEASDLFLFASIILDRMWWLRNQVLHCGQFSVSDFVNNSGSWYAALAVNNSGCVSEAKITFGHSIDPLVAEANAAQLQSQLASKAGSDVGIIFEGDSQVVVDAINFRGKSCNWSIAPLVSDILFILLNVNQWSHGLPPSLALSLFPSVNSVFHFKVTEGLAS
ncbi:Ribonuclease H-like domain containing protein [Quillaja saponaria]|uniref:Ribonuclease H-like domain containing protein n=1 Tax=Quillaja saponaria TaxID=32244 RepID=A0AAD7M350_QUISA|nr:Ribonuclease H-like domain containing protein [Quillaja saponaria]